MTRRISALAAAIALSVLTVAATAVLAHETFRIAGAISAHQGTRLAVKTKQGRTVYIEMTKTTVVLRDKTRVSAAELKPGLSVLVDVLGDDDADLTAKQVRIVPAPGR